jgi:PadR family transcriptional regulator, regulatory protein PadR
MVKKNQPDSEMLKGTLDMMILRTLVGGDAHGHTIAKVIERASEDVLEVEQGSLYPALHRLEDRRWVSSYWGASENNRKAKFNRLTTEGRKQLVRETSRWRQMTRAIGLVMGEEGGALTDGEPLNSRGKLDLKDRADDFRPFPCAWIVPEDGECKLQHSNPLPLVRAATL